MRILAFYLPQFHPIPENDVWWGKGFTEWTNVGKAKPLFRGHYQPRIPADLGYYDLRIPEVREQQAVMARSAGVEGFVYYHYWFGNGKRLLERPFNEVLASGSPDFPFCLAWANESWSGVWHGNPGRILIEQTYPGAEDYVRHFNVVLEAFKDPRYIRVNGKPLLYVYSPFNIPDSKAFISSWNRMALENGFNGIHFVGQSFDHAQAQAILAMGYDGVNTHWQKDIMREENLFRYGWQKVGEKFLKRNLTVSIWDYERFADQFSKAPDRNRDFYPTILSGWDNTPRAGKRGKVFINYHPASFERHVRQVMEQVSGKEPGTNLVFLKSWNEWAEGNYMEPDLRYGHAFLDVLRKYAVG